MSKKSLYRQLCILSVVFVAVIFPTIVFASWEVIGQNDDNEDIYVDNKSVRIKGNLRYAGVYVPSAGYADVVVDCYEKTYLIEYRGGKSYSGTARRDTVIGLLLEEICGNYTPR